MESLFWIITKKGYINSYVGYQKKMPPIRVFSFFSVYSHFRDDKVVAVSSLDWDPICAQAAEMFYAGKNISKQEIQ